MGYVDLVFYKKKIIQNGHLNRNWGGAMCINCILG